MEVEAINNSTVLTIWNDIKDMGISFWVFLILFNITLFKEQWISLFKLIVDKIFRKKKHITYSKKDLQNHPIFKDLEYWLSVGIDSLHLRDNIHPGDEDYINNKEKMAKEVIRIKYETMKEALTKFVNEIDVDSIDEELASTYLMDCLAKENLAQKRKFNERGIPQKFLIKFYVVSDISRQLICNSIKNYLESDCESNTTTMLYLAFNTLDGYLNIIFNDLCETMNVINGDLKAEIFDGKTMSNDVVKRLYAPHSSYPMIVRSKLEEIMREEFASRAILCKYFEKNDELYHSAVYEAIKNGVTSELEHIQMICESQEKGAYNILSGGEIISSDISKFDARTIERFNARGCKAVILIPVVAGEKLEGVLCLDYLSPETFKEAMKDKEIDQKLIKYAEALLPYIQYPEDYKF